MLNKKGSIMDLFVWMALSLALVILLGGIVYVGNVIKTELASKDVKLGPDLNLSKASQDSVAKVVDGYDAVKSGSTLVIVGMLLSILITSFLVRVHPMFFLLHIFITIIAVIVAVPISNFYEDFLGNSVLGPTYGSFLSSNFILLNLPMFVAIIGIIGSVFLVININLLDRRFDSPV